MIVCTTPTPTPVNPPGLGLTKSAEILNPRATNDIGTLVPLKLSTGCFYPNDTTTGAVDSTSNPSPDTPRTDIGDNFNLAVQAAIRDTKLLWERFPLRTQTPARRQAHKPHDLCPRARQALEKAAPTARSPSSPTNPAPNP